MQWLTEDEYMRKYGRRDYKTICTNDMVCWMNYKLTGIPLSQNKNGVMKVIPCTITRYLDSFLVRADNASESFICPFKQKDGTNWAHVTVTKLESNLDIWEIHIFGCDDMSYSCHYLSKKTMEEDIARIKENGISFIPYSDFFFTN